ncbi:MAG: transglutaminase-like domain-containing protein, partial [Aquificaceae bacterium]
GMSSNAYMTTGNTLRLDREINRAIRVKVSSSNSLYLEEDPGDYLQVPQDVSPNLKRLAEDLSRDTKSDAEKLRRVVEHFSKGYQYSLKLEKYEGDPLDYFLFVSRKGNCEYYASATALLLRLMGVPARVVGGYRGALWNQYGGYHIVTNSMAHVWVEAYVNGRWLRVDTTPSYTSPAVRKISSLALIRDSIVSFWYSNIVGYSSQKQIRLFKGIGEGIKAEFSISNLRKRFFELTQLIFLALTFYLAFYLFQRSKKTPENLYRRTRELLHREGIVGEDALPEDIISACRDTELHRYVKFIISIYQRHRYSPYRVYPDEIEEGYRTLKRLKELIRNSRHS